MQECMLFKNFERKEKQNQQEAVTSGHQRPKRLFIQEAAEGRRIEEDVRCTTNPDGSEGEWYLFCKYHGWHTGSFGHVTGDCYIEDITLAGRVEPGFIYQTD